MATVKLVIRKDKVNKAGETPIFILYTYNQKSIKISTGEKVDPDHWEPKKGQVKKTYGRGSGAFNDLLKTKVEQVEEIKRIALQQKIEPTLEYVKEQFVAKDKPRLPEVNRSFFKLYDAFITESKGIRAYNTIRQHRTAYNTLKEFEKASKYKLTLESIDLKFYGKFVSYLINEKKHNPNHIGNTIKNLKIFLGDLTDKGINTNMTFRDRKFKKPVAPVEIITLSQSELDKLFTFDLSEHKRLDKVRDLFVLGCVSGLRFSDIAAIKPANIKGEMIDLTTMKTKDKVEVPINTYARQILDKYQGVLPKVMSNQKMNDYLKELGELVGLIEPVERIKYVGVNRVEYSAPKFELLTTHAARRTFVTLSLEAGMNPKEVMEITGHRNIKTMFKYQNATKKAAQVTMLRIWGNAPTQLKVS